MTPPRKSLPTEDDPIISLKGSWERPVDILIHYLPRYFLSRGNITVELNVI
jgi:hypothetical protein